MWVSIACFISKTRLLRLLFYHRFTPTFITPNDTSRYHGLNERISVTNFKQVNLLQKTFVPFSFFIYISSLPLLSPLSFPLYLSNRIEEYMTSHPNTSSFRVGLRRSTFFYYWCTQRNGAPLSIIPPPSPPAPPPTSNEHLAPDNYNFVFFLWAVILDHGLMNDIDTKTKCRLYWCWIELLDWRYRQLCELLPL